MTITTSEDIVVGELLRGIYRHWQHIGKDSTDLGGNISRNS